MHDATISIRRQLDRLGIMVAGLCALHCVLTILVVSVLGIGGHFLLTPEIHRVGLALAVIFATVAIGWGVVVHRRALPSVFAMGGLCLMSAALVVEHGTLEVTLTIFGVALVSLGHLLNIRWAG